MSQHTPGPWTASGKGGTGTRWNVFATYNPPGVGPSGQILVAQVSVAASGEEREANAHLIAAAPELLAALEELEYKARMTGIESLWETLASARAAIAKAKGGSHA